MGLLTAPVRRLRGDLGFWEDCGTHRLCLAVCPGPLSWVCPSLTSSSGTPSMGNYESTAPHPT